ncbi:MAG TPA: thioesterase family protein [Candidatus Sulfotelmatobacter sp.]|nr:thioesterase family protein [Candidatus Sulfotelmatobacter sp.]
MKNRKIIPVEWGDCDPAQIVYYPRYFEYFDACTTALFKKARISKPEMLEKYGIVGIPLVDAHASFRKSSRFGDRVVVESEFAELGRSSFVVRHRLFNKKVLAVECVETRVWARLSAKNPHAIESAPIPQEVVQKLSGKKTHSSKRAKNRNR